ncbi:putative S-acyltransferase [Platanthera guangdongensis]|uniref:S-acyltransferase n=1 Tax=Platanthera guangdongensis TaxID=2320717 RepID=A0ABR2MUQ8_9ASPA
MRRHGWELPLHPLQFVGIGVFTSLVVAFYVFLAPFLGNRTAKNTALTLFSFATFSVIFLYIRCTAIDPSDRTNSRRKKGAKLRGITKLNYKFILNQIIMRIVRKLEHKILKCCIRRKYLDPWNNNVQMDLILPFSPLVVDDAIAPHMKDDDITFCFLCDFEVKRHSKHCRTCNRCVDGFDHHCKWLNNCIGRRNYTTFILLLVFTMLTLIIEGGTAVAIFIRCFASKSISLQLKREFHIEFPKGVLVAISALLAALTAYSSAALGQLFFFHVVLIRKGMRTYDYILAMREESQSIHHFDDFDISSDDSDYDDSPERPRFFSRFICQGHQEYKSSQSISILAQEGSPPANSEKAEIRIDPWKLINMSKEKAKLAAEKARERLRGLKPSTPPLKPLPLEKKKGPALNAEIKKMPASSEKPRISASTRRRFSSSASPRPQKYKSSFDLKLAEVSRELETYISRQVAMFSFEEEWRGRVFSRIGILICILIYCLVHNSFL